MLVIIAALFITLSLTYRESRKAVGGEFPEYYIAGQMLLRGEPVYDIELHSTYYRQMANTDRMLPFVSGPFLLVMFAPLSLLPFPVAYAVWLVISAILFGVGILLLAPKESRIAALWLGFGFPTTLIDMLVVGQIPAIGFCAVAAAIALERRNKPFYSGAALAVCLYKPPLLLWSIPFLLTTRRWRTIAGFAASAATLAGMSLTVAGRDVCTAWFRILLAWAGNVTASSSYKIPTWKYVDLNAFRKLVLPEGAISLAATVGLAAALVAGLCVVWVRATPDLAWAATLTANLGVNLYTPIYDCVLVVAVVLLLYPRLRPVELLLIGFGLTACGWLAIPIGDVHTPPMTVALGALLMFQVALAVFETGIPRKRAESATL